MKKEDANSKYPFWICPNCNKANKLNFRFCIGCGTEKPSQNEINIKYYNTKNIKETEPYNSTNIEILDWMIMIAALSFAAIVLLILKKHLYALITASVSIATFLFLIIYIFTNI